jgi:dGTPase
MDQPSRSKPTWAVVDRRAKEDREERDLAPFAMKSRASRGRRHPEPEDPLRTCWERDRDRIIHCTAFRRLMYKTQVFVNRRGDHNRTRLSHTLEVSQVARSVGSALGLSEPLCESIALVHDIGHPPFGHRGERVLNALMASAGGFRHNAQVLSVIDELERRSPDYPGLNLTREVRQAVLKHEGESTWPDEFAPRPASPLLEAQVVDLADSTAYDVHDIEDGLLAGMFSELELAEEVELWRTAAEEVERRHPRFLRETEDRNLRVKRVTNQVLKASINDLIEQSAQRIESAGVRSPADVQAHDRLLVGHGKGVGKQVAALQSFLHEHFYRHEHLTRFSEYARLVLSGLFERYVDDPTEMVPWYRRRAEEVGTERAVCDYVAGMTDRFAEREYERFFGRLPDF